MKNEQSALWHQQETLVDKQGEHPVPVRGSCREDLAAPMTRSRGATAQML